jgi:phage-related protein
MSAAEFPFIPDWSASIAVSPRIAKVDYGDGYAQRMAQGINHQLETVQLTFSGRTDAEAAAIKAFFAKRGGVRPFTAQIGIGANAPIKKYVTEGEWKHVLEYNDYNAITVTFQEVP